MIRSVLLTGPTNALDRWRAALEHAGLRVETRALVETVDEPIDRGSLPRPDWVAFTSANAVLSFGPAGDLVGVPCAAVGGRTATVARDHGYAVELVSEVNAEHLAGLLLGRDDAARVLWPRGDLAHAFADRLREAGREVHDPVAYRTVPREVAGPPVADAVFFASPSAVRTWLARWEAAGVAIAIGATTAAALAEGGWPAAEVLARPTPDALLEALGRLGA